MKKLLRFLDNRNNFIIMSIPYKLWGKKNLLLRYIYILIPWIVLFFFYLTVFLNNAFSKNKTITFALLDDLTNLLIIPYIWIFGYYFLMYFFKKSEFEIQKTQNKLYKNRMVKIEQKIKNIDRVFKLTQLFAYLIPIAGFLFIDFAKKNNGIWYNHIPPLGHPIFIILVCMSWYFCSCIVLTAVFSSIKIHTILKYVDDKTPIDVYHSDNNCGFSEISRILVSNFGIAFYLVFAGIIIVFSDFNAYNVTNGFIKTAFADNPLLIFIFALMFIMYSLIVVIPIFELRELLNDRILSAKISTIEDKERITSFPVNIKTIRTFISVWIIPLIMAIFAGVSALSNK